jgi:hypothetical protein
MSVPNIDHLEISKRIPGTASDRKTPLGIYIICCMLDNFITYYDLVSVFYLYGNFCMFIIFLYIIGELNWVFTSITDTIAWNVLPQNLFQKLYRQDTLVSR